MLASMAEKASILKKDWESKYKLVQPQPKEDNLALCIHHNLKCTSPFM